MIWRSFLVIPARSLIVNVRALNCYKRDDYLTDSGRKLLEILLLYGTRTDSVCGYTRFASACILNFKMRVCVKGNFLIARGLDFTVPWMG